MGQKIDKEEFDKFFTDSYCPVDYETVREEFERIAEAGNDIFTGSYEARNLNRDNFILYLTGEAYCDFEAVVQEAMDTLNPEILDAGMDVVEQTPDGDEITEKYWDTGRELLKEFLEKLYDTVIATWRENGWRKQAVTLVSIMFMTRRMRPVTARSIWMRTMRRASCRGITGSARTTSWTTNMRW